MEITAFMINHEIFICYGQGKYDKVIYDSMKRVLFLIDRKNNRLRVSVCITRAIDFDMF